MRLPPLSIAVPLLLLLLTWLALHALNEKAEAFDRALGALDRFAMLESALQRDVLSARAGILHNYDPLVREASELDASVDSLRETAAVSRPAAAALDRLAISVDHQEDLVEQFKSNNALLQNSLASFDLLSSGVSAEGHADPIVPAVSALAAAMLHLSLDTSPTSAREVETRLQELAIQSAISDERDLLRGLLAHAQLLHDLLPATDGILNSLTGTFRKRDREIIRSEVLDHQTVSRMTARRFRLLLYVTSVCLVGLLTLLWMQLRARNRTLQRRVAFEHAIAALSTRFINAPTHAIGAYVEQALAELAGRLGADRAYFLPRGASDRMHVWNRAGLVYPTGWPEGAKALARRFQPAADRVVHISSIARLSTEADRDALASIGLSDWICVRGASGNGDDTLLGFDTLTPRTTATVEPGELGLLQMALDAIANAVGRQLLEREQTRLEQHLQQARRMETVGALTSGIAHNFNNIVGAILGYAEMAEAQVAAQTKIAQNLGEIRRAGERARDLVDQILTFGRRREIRRRPVSVRDLVAESVSLLHASLPSGIELMAHDVPTCAVINGERAQLQQVILNLCNNAAQAMNGSGHIDVQVSMLDAGRGRGLSHGELPPGRQVAIIVRDSGRGMDDRMLGRIFEPFFTTRMAGTGLGLATVREIVREHGGAMNVQSRLGAGSRFEAWFPCAIDVAPAPDDEPATLPLGHGETVLLIHSERERLLKDEELLAALGYEPVGFIDPCMALAACRERPKRFDMAVISHILPVTSAMELARILGEIVPEIPILLAMASADHIGPDQLVTARISDIVSWPFVASEIAAALERCSPKAARTRDLIADAPEYREACLEPEHCSGNDHPAG